MAPVGARNPLMDETKHHILCYMFTHYSFAENRISQLANPRMESCAMLRERVLAAQPSLISLGGHLDRLLESFVSNQNSRIFCALTRLHEWYTSTLPYTLQGLTLKHLRSLFSRAPCVIRPHTTLPTHAMRVVMIYHLCDPKAWDVILRAYAELYAKLHGREWEDRELFEVGVEDNLHFPPHVLEITSFCVPSFAFPKPRLLSSTATGDDSDNGTCTSESKPVTRDGSAAFSRHHSFYGSPFVRASADRRTSNPDSGKTAWSSATASVAGDGGASPELNVHRSMRAHIDRGPAFPHVGYLGGSYTNSPAATEARMHVPRIGAAMEHRTASAPWWFERNAGHSPAAAAGGPPSATATMSPGFSRTHSAGTQGIAATPQQLIQTASAPAFRLAAAPTRNLSPAGDALSAYFGSPYAESPMLFTAPPGSPNNK
ncbi:hypothetical protein IWQ57_000685 [Coemansia nantahalensis]|uniref:Uncharacterized protein n=1 Tax=Coemansia nantahalensis TaxID=2789366 RepID=A0ACC1K713_9FUNG|nr:hypothetical protein IWQ57_000685 [Coemansia nantahalensis]